jgi:IclR family transcriptional regulator, acetate operon repressor
MHLLEIFAKERRELSNSELARLMDLAESSCSDLLHTLLQLGYLSRTASTKRFYPTNRLLAQANAIGTNNPLLAVGAEATELLSQKTGETATCGVLESEAVLIVAMHEGTHRLRYQRTPGDRIPLHTSAIGKALMGQVEPAERSRLLRLRPLKALTKHTKTNPSEIEKEVQAQVKRGWFTTRNEASEGASGLAVAGRVGLDHVGLSIVGPTERFDANDDRYVSILLEVSAMVFASKEEETPEPSAEDDALARGRPGRPKVAAFPARSRASGSGGANPSSAKGTKRMSVDARRVSTRSQRK